MAGLQFLAVVLCVASVLASPRNLLHQNSKRDPGSGGDHGPPSHPHDDTWGSTSDGGPSQYGGSWDHGSSSESSKDHHGNGGDDWGHSSTCAALTITETSISTLTGPTSTVYISESGHTSILPASTVYISGSDYTSFVPASTVYISGSGYTSFLPASTVYISGPGYTSILPASTEKVPGPAKTIVSTSYETLTLSAPQTTVYLTRFGSGWNHTVTRGETDVVTTTQTQHDYSTIYNEETTTLTSVVTLPGEQPSEACSIHQYTDNYTRYYEYDFPDYYKRHHRQFRLHSTR